MLATDLHAFNTSLGATIEEQVVDALNKLRTLWDPDQKYSLYEFERQPQTFPDVVLRASDPSVVPQVLMGIEMKGWYVLAKEKEPSFRFQVTPAACAEADLIVVVPWALSKVISGSPEVFMPFVMGARQAAEFRNWHWQYKKVSTTDTSITLSSVTTHYPSKSDPISDVPASDGGGNFGRLARSGVMDSFIAERFDDKLSGIPMWAWQAFLALFKENKDPDFVPKGLEALAKTVMKDPSAQKRAKIDAKLKELGELLSED
ncbi:hypothetical protein NA2_18181 [Nitratireductor pacificus pht-3B]|uniref:Uncharacterized protein n=1 Tax=Nitratireductor pacificus pht-3B TaxID=391937 RepID=K2MJU5_9HYPH|nr:hypothetical protein NA2_18181 [Nitratireductor pacificus pht-3B]